MITKNLSTLKIHKLTKEQYKRELESGNLDEHAIYLTPDEDMDLSNYATKAELAGKANKEHSHAIADVADLQTTLEGKTPYGHKHSAADLTSGTLNADRLPIVPISKGGTGAETATGLLNNLGIAASANELNYVKGVTSGIQSQLDSKSPSTHTHDYAGSASPGGSATRAVGDKDGNEITATYETKEQSTKNLQAAKDHADTAAATVKAEILGGAEGAYDTLKELKELIDAGDSDAVEALQQIAAGKADKKHTHVVENIEDLQDVLDDKQDTITGAAATITANNLTGNRVLVSNISGKVAASDITDVELGYLDNVTSNIQTQINQKFDKAGGNINGRVGVSGSVELNNGENYVHLVISRMKGGKTHSAGMLPSSDDGSTIILHQTDGTIDNQLTLSPTATYLKQPLSVDSGGTGANNAASARTNLGITPANIGAAPSSHTHTIAQVTSLQDSLNAKQNVVNGGASTITSSNLTASRALVSNTDGKVAVSAVTSTELGYLDGVTANVQTQLDGKIKIGSFGNSNINALYDMGMYSIQAGSNCPSGAQYGVVLTMPYRKAYTNTKPDHGAQIYLPNGDDPTTPNEMFFRTSLASTWNNWNKVLHSNNYSSYALPITGGNLTGDLTTSNGSIWASKSNAEAGVGVIYKDGQLYFHGNSGNGARGIYDSKYGGVITVEDSMAYFNGQSILSNHLKYFNTDEINFSGANTNSAVYFNYRNIDNGGEASGNTAISKYLFCNRNGSTSGVTIQAESFTGNAATATTASGLSNAGTLTTSESINNFITANKLQYALFQLQTDIGVGFASHDGMLLSIPWTSTTYGAQIAIDDNTTNPKIAIRGKNTSWGGWKILPFSDGTNASGTWGINITGSAAKLTTARTISLTGSVTGSGSFDGSGNLSIATTTNHTHSYLPLSGGTMTDSIITPKNDNMGIIPHTDNYGQIGSAEKKFYRMYASTFYGNLSGNATTANYTNYINAINLPANADLNSYETPGFYYSPANATVATFSNCPTSNAFFMIVGKHAGIYQEVTEYMTSSYKKYVRNYYNGSWGSWRQISFTDHTHSYLPLSGGTMNSGARISHGGSLYLGNENNSGWVYTQDIASHSGNSYWAINVAGSAWFKDVHIGGYTYSTKGSYALNTSSFYCQSWVRSGGDTGWYNETYGGGWYMNDITWIRTYGGKNIYQNTGIMRTDGTLQVGADGAYFNSSSSGTKIGGQLSVTYSGVGGVTIEGSGTTTGLQITRTDTKYGVRLGVSSSGAVGCWFCDYNKSDTSSIFYRKPTDANATTYLPGRLVMSGSYGTGNPPTTGTLVNGMVYYKIIS